MIKSESLGIPAYAGVDLGGTKIAVCVADARGKVFARHQIATEAERGPEHVIDRIAGLLETAEANCGRTVAAIGVGVPGLAELRTGKVLFLPNLPSNWRGVPLGSVLRKRTGRPVRVANDAFGKRGRSDNLLLVTLGTGIGGGLVLNGHLLLGRYGAAGEIGHQTLVPDGEFCGCGNRGCLETLVSGPALVAAAKKALRRGRAPILKSIVSANGGVLTPHEMVLAVSRGDDAVAEIIARAAGYLGIGIANVVTITGVDRVVLTGGLTALGDLLLKPVRRTIRERIGMFPTGEIKVERSKLADRAGALGAVAMAAGLNEAFKMEKR